MIYHIKVFLKSELYIIYYNLILSRLYCIYVYSNLNLAMERFMKSKTKFSRKLTNKINRSLALINSNLDCSHNINNTNIINNDCLQNTVNYDSNENATNLNESQINENLSCVDHSYVNINIPDINVHDNVENLTNNDRHNSNATNDILFFSQSQMNKNLSCVDYSYVNIPDINVYDNVENLTNSDQHNSNATNYIPFVLKLAKWAIEENITLSALNNLLPIISEIPGYDNIPKDARTILKTPTNITVTSLGCGTYYYFGIEKTINSFCINNKINIQRNGDLLLAINIDGLPLSKSTNSSFWPILCSIKSIKILMNQVFVVTLYHGSNKQKPVDDFLRDFVNECVHLSNNGIFINSFRHNFRVLMLVCDSPAKSFILSIKNHTGHFSCTKCDQEGDMSNNLLCFIETERLCKRTDISFRTFAQAKHHTGKNLLLDIPNFNMIDSVPIDYMHNLLLGSMRRLLCHKRYGWIFGKPPYKLRVRDVTKI